MVDLFSRKIANLIERVTAKQKPKAVVVCMIYYPCEKGEGWADRTLRAIGYNKNPGHVQAIIRKVFELATKRIQLEGCDVIPFALFECLDPKDPGDYEHRVEPSAVGGRKIADRLLTSLQQHGTV